MESPLPTNPSQRFCSGFSCGPDGAKGRADTPSTHRKAPVPIGPWDVLQLLSALTLLDICLWVQVVHEVKKELLMHHATLGGISLIVVQLRRH